MDRSDDLHFSRAGTAKRDEIYEEAAEEPDQTDRHAAAPSGQHGNRFESAFADEQKNTTVISSGTTITGDIKSDGNIEMMGTMTGSILTSGSVKINGKQVGDVQGAGIDLFACTVRGSLNAADEVNVDSDSVIVGDIKCGNLTIDGKLKGNVHVMGNVCCQGNSVIIGDITSTTITVSSGAKLKGKVEISDGSIEPVEVGTGETSALSSESEAADEKNPQ
ncbi:bactofilin family protein [Caproiciproducens sp. NJN-50]|uniref:bactofilin family protein n=1 Tax=Caproiciproducens sp. NJN-50 TaxID=2507162 RepID=UPI0013E8C35B|nr:polymer-forming cytoskeletal protein [Caproiciproducens sp. NJN-50]